MADFAAVILQCEKPLHHCSDAFESSFSLGWNRVTVKSFSQYLQYLRSYLEIFTPHLAAAVLLLKTDNTSPVCRYVIIIIWSRYDLFWLLVPEKIAFCLQRSGTKYRYFIWAKRSTARRAVMVHSARRIALLLASFDVALPSERKKPSWIDWTIENSPCTRWFLLGRFPARRSHFGVSHHATCCARRSLTSYRPVVNTCSHFGSCVRRRHMPRKTARAPPQVPQHFDGARANGSLFAPPVDLISYTSYGTDYKTQEYEQNRSRNRDFLNFCLVSPQVGPVA